MFAHTDGLSFRADRPAFGEMTGTSNSVIQQEVCPLINSGIKGGQAYGKTDETASNVVEGKVGASDFNASIAFALGLPYDLVMMSSSKRPFKMGGQDGKPITGIFS